MFFCHFFLWIAKVFFFFLVAFSFKNFSKTNLTFYWVASIAIPVGKWVIFLCYFLIFYFYWVASMAILVGKWVIFLCCREWRFSASLNKIYPYGAQEWKVNWINKTGDEKWISGVLKATSNGLRQQFFARRWSRNQSEQWVSNRPYL